MKIIRFTVTQQEQIFSLVHDGQSVVHQMVIKFSLSKWMSIIEFLTLYPPKREAVSAEIRYRYDGQTRWLYQGIWADTGTTATEINYECIKYLIVATLHDGRWFPVKQISSQPLPNDFTIEVQLRSQRDWSPLGERLRERIVFEDGVITNRDIVV